MEESGLRSIAKGGHRHGQSNLVPGTHGLDLRNDVPNNSARRKLIHLAKSCLDFLQSKAVSPNGKLYFTTTADGKPLRMRRMPTAKRSQPLDSRPTPARLPIRGPRTCDSYEPIPKVDLDLSWRWSVPTASKGRRIDTPIYRHDTLDDLHCDRPGVTGVSWRPDHS